MRPKSGIPLEVKFYSREKYECTIVMNEYLSSEFILVNDKEELIRKKELIERISELVELLRENPQLLDLLKELVRKRKS